MIQAYLKESLHWLHLVFFKPVTFDEKAEGLTKKQALAIYFKTFPLGLILTPILSLTIGLACKLAGSPFNWAKAFLNVLMVVLILELIFGLIIVLILGLSSRLISPLIIMLIIALIIVLIFVLSGGLSSGLIFGLIFGLSIGLILGLMSVLIGMLNFGLIGGLIFGLLFGLLFGLGGGPIEALKFGVTYLITFSFFFFRPFYLLPHLIQYRRSIAARNPFEFFRNSPVYWDEVIGLPLPFLSRWLVKLAQADRSRGVAEIGFVAANRPHQRRAAQKALLAVFTDDLRKVDSVEKLARTGDLLRAFPAAAKYLPAGFDEARRPINSIAGNARRYEQGEPPTKLILLETMARDLEGFRTAIAQTPIGATFYPIAERWLEMVRAAEEELRRRLNFTPIRNPFIAGNALQEVDGNLFKGRRDIIRALEENIIHPQQRAALLLYGRRRIGKSSTLLNLPNLISSSYLPIYIDLQEGKWREGDGMFCYHLARAIYREFYQSALSDALKPPIEPTFAQRPFTRLADYLDTVEEVLRRVGKQALITFDEYERLNPGIESGKITTEVFNLLRHLVQHRQSLVLLFSGSHRFEELKTVNWADYLINAKTLEISFLEPEEARELMERPAPEFNMRYEPGVVDRILELTHRQPYLLQMIGSELVNQLNTRNRTTATRNDLKSAVKRTLISAQGYFYNMWADECSNDERRILLDLAESHEPGKKTSREALQSLLRKEIVEMDQNGYRLSVEIFRFWILKNQIGTDDLRIEALA